MIRRSQRLTAAAASAVLATTGAVVGLDAGPAQAKVTASPWIQLSAGYGVNNSYQPRVVRWQGKLLVTWIQTTPDNSNTALNTRLLSNKAKPIGAITAALSPVWSSVSSDPDPFLLGGVPTIAFGGNRSLDTSDPYNGQMSFVQAPDATSWTLGTGALTSSRSAYGDYGLGAVDDGTGVPVTAGAYSSTDHISVHHGFDTVPPTATDIQLAPTGGDAYNTNVARDLKTGVTYAIWYSSANDAANQGIRAAEIWPAQGAPMAPAPLSTVPFQGQTESVNSIQDVGITSRIGGGVWAVYSSGYPSPHTVVLWKVGTSTKLTLKTSGEVQYPTVSAGPGGRLWVSWIEGSQIRAVRTNPSVTTWGVVRALTTPAADGDAPTSITGDGQLGPLDAVINVANKPLVKGGNPAPQIFSARILEGLRVAATHGISYKKGGTVVVVVTDAGLPVPGVRVVVGGKAKTTNAAGKVTFAVPAKSAKGAHSVVATAAGWWPGSASFKVG
ncbi:hypothetical protein acdb102_13200 [Acidothermaceae bacterium B102]|nr:hypothetical protein acdb102_13200 [Acidothermaceae bacterium B102]